MLSLHIITSPQGHVEALRSNVNKTKQKILITNTSLLNFDTHKGLTVKIYIISVCTYTAAMGFTSDACWFLLIKNKKRGAALKNEAGGDEKHVFFFYLA